MGKFNVGDRVVFRDPEDRVRDGMKATVVFDFTDGDYLIALDVEGKGRAYKETALLSALNVLHDVKMEYDKKIYWVAHEKNLFAEVKDDSNKFKVGDQVHLKERRARSEDIPEWAVWVVKEIYRSPSGGYSYKVKCNKSENMSVEIICDADDLVEARPTKRHIVIEITDDGATGKYVIGKKVEKTAEIRRSPEDEPDDYAAAEYILEKLAGKTLGAIHALREFADEIGRVTDDFKKKLG